MVATILQVTGISLVSLGVGLVFPQTALIGMPRKNGKSALSSAAIGLYSLIAEGINGGEVIAVAAEEEQARIVFGEAKRMVENSELNDLWISIKTDTQLVQLVCEQIDRREWLRAIALFCC